MTTPARVIRVPSGEIPPELAARSPFAGLDICAEAGWLLPPDAHRSNFDEDIWDNRAMVDAPRTLTKGQRIWDFSTIINPRWRLTAKELIFAMAVPQHPAVLALPDANRTPNKPQSCYSLVKEVGNWLNWLTEQGVEHLEDVLQEHCDAYQEVRSYYTRHESLAHRKIQASSQAGALRPVKYLGWYTGLFTSEGYRRGFVPWGKTVIADVVGRDSTEGNRTPPVPDSVFQPAVAAALFLVETLGPLVANLVDFSHRQDTELPAAGSFRKWSAERRQRFLDRLDWHAREKVPFPRLEEKYIKNRLKSGWQADDPLLEVNLRRVLQESIAAAYLSKPLMDHVRPYWVAAAEAAGVGEEYGRDAALVARVDDPQVLVPWTPPISRSGVRDLQIVVLSACRVVVAALSGMRASELAELTPQSTLPPITVSGGTQRFKLASKLVKGQVLGGVDEEWVVLEPAYRAVELAARLSRAGDDEAVFAGAAMDWAYKRFRDWVNSPAGQRLGLPRIPEGPVNGRMLRRTLSLMLAHRPGGLLAAKIQLKHVSVVTTEGYAARPGGAQGTLLAEMRKAEKDHHLQLTADAYHDWREGRLPSGVGARDLIHAFEHIDKELADNSPGPAVVLESDRRLENLLRQQAKFLHVQTANYCWFRDPAKALCLKLAGTPEADKPLAGMCDSSRCAQATHHPCHRPVWASKGETVQVFLGNPRTPKGEKMRLTPELDRVVRVLAEIDAASAAGGN
ncbi:hypothetical protein ABT083_23505 [Streptomyces goshikiensis]|uniref:hypothetical protein n=1 Tax=Streptomyces TaxID=1883 RepID=UPI00093969A7|nr:hypothetical protein [Streptomyces sp. CB03578]OKI44418.1 hypothetical protein A6A28_02300 [Streptomyces sp. CB03578]